MSCLEVYDLLVSVIMAVYNTKETWLRQSVESILRQTLEDFEFIIILDCPTDNSAEIISEYEKKDHRVQTLVNERNLGLTKSLNRGLEIARGKYIARMDADDISVCYRLERQVCYLESHRDVVAVGSRCYTNSNKTVGSGCIDDHELLRIRMLFHNVGLPHPTAMIRRSVLLQHNIKYTEWAKKAQDYKLWVDLLPFGELVLLSDVLLIYREHAAQISGNGGSLSYAHKIAIEQAEFLMGQLSEQEKLFHCTATETQLPGNDAVGLNRYLERIKEVNKEKKIYNQEQLSLELDYIWCKKAYWRFVIERKTDMLFFARTLRIFTPRLFQYLRENKHRTKAYIKAKKAFKEKELANICEQNER